MIRRPLASSRLVAAALAAAALTITGTVQAADADPGRDTVQVTLPVVDGGITVTVAPAAPDVGAPAPPPVGPGVDTSTPVPPAPPAAVPAPPVPSTPDAAPPSPGPSVGATAPTPATASGPSATPAPAEEPGSPEAPRTVGPPAGPTLSPSPVPPTQTDSTDTPPSPARTGPFRFGVFGHSSDRASRFQEKMGRPLDVIGVFPARGSWESIMDTWWLDRAPAGFDGVLDVGVPLWQDDGDLATAAAGGYDQQWETLGRTIHDRYPGSTVRIGWEFNLGGWNHHATDENVDQWKQAFRHASVALKRGGPSLLVSWNPNKGRGDSLPDATTAWPGDDVVDIVALDAYDWWPAYNESTWPEHRDGDQGWAHWIDFARRHGKQFAVPEWGVAPGNDHGGGDNPYYIGVVMDLLQQEHAKDGLVHSVVYFDEPEAYIANSIADGQVPLAGRALADRVASLGRPIGSAASPGLPTPPPDTFPTAIAPQTATPAAPSPDSASPPTPTPAPAPATQATAPPAPDATSGRDDGAEPADEGPAGAASDGEEPWSSSDGHGPVPR